MLFDKVMKFKVGDRLVLNSGKTVIVEKVDAKHGEYHVINEEDEEDFEIVLERDIVVDFKENIYETPKETQAEPLPENAGSSSFSDEEEKKAPAAENVELSIDDIIKLAEKTNLDVIEDAGEVPELVDESVEETAEAVSEEAAENVTGIAEEAKAVSEEAAEIVTGIDEGKAEIVSEEISDIEKGLIEENAEKDAPEITADMQGGISEVSAAAEETESIESATAAEETEGAETSVAAETVGEAAASIAAETIESSEISEKTETTETDESSETVADETIEADPLESVKAAYRKYVAERVPSVVPSNIVINSSVMSSLVRTRNARWDRQNTKRKLNEKRKYSKWTH